MFQIYFKVKRIKIKAERLGTKTSCMDLENDFAFVSNFSLKENLIPKQWISSSGREFWISNTARFTTSFLFFGHLHHLFIPTSTSDLIQHNQLADSFQEGKLSLLIFYYFFSAPLRLCLICAIPCPNRLVCWSSECDQSVIQEHEQHHVDEWRLQRVRNFKEFIIYYKIFQLHKKVNPTTKSCHIFLKVY